MSAKSAPTKIREQLELAYLLVFDSFSANRSDVAEALNVSKSVATSRLNKLRDAGLIDAVDINEESQGSARSGAFKEVEWQASETYDSISREEAIAKFAAAFPEPAPAKSASEKLADNDAKLRTGVKPESKPKPAAKKAPKLSGPSKDVLVKAAKLRAEGATWNEIRSATGTKLGSSAWFRYWEREGIEHIPAGQRVKPKAEKPAESAPAAKAKPAKKAPAPKTSGAAMKPDADAIERGKASVERARAARAAKPARKGTARTSNGRAAPVRTRKAATAAELAVAA